MRLPVKRRLLARRLLTVVVIGLLCSQLGLAGRVFAARENSWSTTTQVFVGAMLVPYLVAELLALRDLVFFDVRLEAATALLTAGYVIGFAGIMFALDDNSHVSPVALLAGLLIQSGLHWMATQLRHRDAGPQDQQRS